MSSYKNFIAIHFSAYSITNFGQSVLIVGNCPQLGMWNPQRGLMLQTNPKEYPIWFTKHPITLPKLTNLEYKLCIVDKNGAVVRWQSLKNNRNLSLKASCSVFLTEGEPEAEYDFQNSQTTSTQIDSTKKTPLSEIQEEDEEDEPNLSRKNSRLESFENERKRSGSSKNRNWISLEENEVCDASQKRETPFQDKLSRIWSDLFIIIIWSFILLLNIYLNRIATNFNRNKNKQKKLK